MRYRWVAKIIYLCIGCAVWVAAFEFAFFGAFINLKIYSSIAVVISFLCGTGNYLE
jgi:hypothetical protein